MAALVSQRGSDRKMTLLNQVSRAALAVGVGLLTTLTSASQEASPLKLTLTQVQETSSRTRFRAKLHNSGKQPLTINLGEVFPSPSRKQFPRAIHLWLTDAHGKTLALS
jgi:hypothetical protein